MDKVQAGFLCCGALYSECVKQAKGGCLHMVCVWQGVGTPCVALP
jgi:hypothetical protein